MPTHLDCGIRGTRVVECEVEACASDIGICSQVVGDGAKTHKAPELVAGSETIYEILVQRYCCPFG